MHAANDTVETASSFADSIASLPPLPATAQKILTCFGDEFIDARKVAEVVEGDPGICARLLGLANSAYFGLAQPVTNIEGAISRVLGVDTVRSLVLAMAIQQSFNSKSCPSFNVERFWRQSLMTAECCKRIVTTIDAASDDDRDLAYSVGLCHNLGLMALVHLQPKRCNRALAQLRGQEPPVSMSSTLYEEFATTHKIMTTELARKWSLPELMTASYQHRAFPEQQCNSLLGFVVSAAVVAVENTAYEDDERTSLRQWAEVLDIGVVELQDLAEFGERQTERVESLAGNMSG